MIGFGSDKKELLSLFLPGSEIHKKISSVLEIRDSRWGWVGLWFQIVVVVQTVQIILAVACLGMIYHI